MEEKIIVQSKNYNVKGFVKAIIIIGGIFSFIWMFITGSDFPFLESIVIFGMFGLGAWLIHIFLEGHEFTVTDKRVYGKTYLGKRVDLPLNKISSVALTLFKGIGVATSSGRIVFLFCVNRDELFSGISNLLIANQKPTNDTIIKQVINYTEADELKKYKDLLDSGAITQEEFDAKKSQLLNL